MSSASFRNRTASKSASVRSTARESMVSAMRTVLWK